MLFFLAKLQLGRLRGAYANHSSHAKLPTRGLPFKQCLRACLRESWCNVACGGKHAFLFFIACGGKWVSLMPGYIKPIACGSKLLRLLHSRTQVISYTNKSLIAHFTLSLIVHIWSQYPHWYPIIWKYLNGFRPKSIETTIIKIKWLIYV